MSDKMLRRLSRRLKYPCPLSRLLQAQMRSARVKRRSLWFHSRASTASPLAYNDGHHWLNQRSLSLGTARPNTFF